MKRGTPVKPEPVNLLVQGIAFIVLVVVCVLVAFGIVYLVEACK